jgi:hypothetical protein
MYLAIATSPDITKSVGKLAVYISKPGQAHWVAAQRGIIYIKDVNFDRERILHEYSDTSFSSEKKTDAKSITDYVFLSAGGTITWGSHKQTLTTLSECLALTGAMSMDDVVYLSIPQRDI